MLWERERYKYPTFDQAFSVSVVMAALFPRGSGEDGLNFIEFQRWFVNGDRQLLVHFGWAVQAILYWPGLIPRHCRVLEDMICFWACLGHQVQSGPLKHSTPTWWYWHEQLNSVLKILYFLQALCCVWLFLYHGENRGWERDLGSKIRKE